MKNLLLLLALAISAPAFAQSTWTNALLGTAGTNSLNIDQLGTDNAGGLYYVIRASGSFTTNNIVAKIIYRAPGTTTDVDVSGNYPSTGCNTPRAIAAAPDGSVWVVNEILVCNGTFTNVNEVMYKNASAGSNNWTITSGGPGQSGNPSVTSPIHIFTWGIANQASGVTCFLGFASLYCNHSSGDLAFVNIGNWAAPFPYTLTAASAAAGGQTTYTGTALGYMPVTGILLVAGFTNSGNNGNFPIVSSTSTTVTVTNSGGVAETHAATGAPNFNSTSNTGGTTAIGYALSFFDGGDGLGECMTAGGEHDPTQMSCGGGTPSFPAQVFNDFAIRDQSGAMAGFGNDTYNIRRLGNSTVILRPGGTSKPGCSNFMCIQMVQDGSSRTQSLANSSGFVTISTTTVQNSFYLGGTGSSTKFVSFITDNSGIHHLFYSTTNGVSAFTDEAPVLITLFSGCGLTGASFGASAASDGTHLWATCKDTGTGLWKMGIFGPPAPTPVSIALTPNPFTIAVTATQTLTCTTTLSDSSTRACISPSLLSSDATKASVAGLVVTGVAPGTGTITATAESLTSPTDAFTVTAPFANTKIIGATNLLGGAVW